MKAVDKVLRTVGTRSPALHAASVQVAKRLTESGEDPARWIGKKVLREIGSASVHKRLKRRSKASWRA